MTTDIDVPENVRERIGELPSYGVPAFIYDLEGLRDHMGEIRSAFAAVTAGPQLFYAAKANPDSPILQALEPFIDGVEVSSIGELTHVREALPDVPLAFGGPGKTPAHLATAVDAGARIHVESPTELARLIAFGKEAEVLVRVNPPFEVEGAALAMGGGATPFGMDEEGLAACDRLLDDAPSVRVRGVHAHLASGLDAPRMVKLAAQILEWARPWCAERGITGPEFNLGGGMAVDYTAPRERFDWAGYAAGLAELIQPGERLRIEPGRAVTASCGWYVTSVVDIKRSHGEWFAVLLGGTHHLRTPVAKGHDQPFAILPGDGPRGPNSVEGEAVTLVGQLCTPKDVFARRVVVESLAVGDTVAFGMAGAYGWNISHHDFLMHPKPSFHYLG
jgi:diaminopimelate decarboxylase